MTNEDEAALIAAAKGGSSGAFGRLIDHHQQAVRGFLRRLCASRAEADDLAQETFLAAWEKLDAFRGGASLRSWLCAIGWRQAKSAQRGLFRRLGREGSFLARQEMQRPGEIGAEDRMAVQAALIALPLEQRAAVALCLAQDFSHAEAAGILGLPLGTVKSHVARGRARLLETLGDRP